jgi:hypothetical protein
MSTPKILLVSRRTLEAHPDKFKELAGVDVQMAVAASPADAEAAKKLTEAVAQFQYVTAIVADFEADLAINEDGSVSPIGYTPVIQKDPDLITEA